MIVGKYPQKNFQQMPLVSKKGCPQFRSARPSTPVHFGEVVRAAQVLRAQFDEAHLAFARCEANSLAWETALTRLLSVFVQSVGAERALLSRAQRLVTEDGLCALARREQLTDQMFLLFNSGVQNVRVDFIELQWPLTPVNTMAGHDIADQIKYKLLRKILDEAFATEKKSPRSAGLITAAGGSFFLVHAQDNRDPVVLSPARIGPVIEKLNAALAGFQIALSSSLPAISALDLSVVQTFARTTHLQPVVDLRKVIRKNRRGYYSNLKFIVSGVLAGGVLPKSLLKNAKLREVDAKEANATLPKFIPDLDVEGKDIRLHHALNQHAGSIRLLESFAQTLNPEAQAYGEVLATTPMVESVTQVWRQSISQAERVTDLALRDPGFPWFFRRETFREALEELFQEQKPKGARYFNLGFSDVNYWYSMNAANPVSALDTEFYKMLQLHQRVAATAKYSFKKSRSDELIFACAGQSPQALLQRVARAYRRAFPVAIPIFGKFERNGVDVRLPLFQLKQKMRDPKLREPRPLDEWQAVGFLEHEVEPFRDFIGETSSVVTHIPWSVRKDDDMITKIIAWADIAAGNLKAQNRRGQNRIVSWRNFQDL